MGWYKTTTTDSPECNVINVLSCGESALRGTHKFWNLRAHPDRPARTRRLRLPYGRLRMMSTIPEHLSQYYCMYVTRHAAPRMAKIILHCLGHWFQDLNLIALHLTTTGHPSSTLHMIIIKRHWSRCTEWGVEFAPCRSIASCAKMSGRLSDK